jgi:hypothetical protein
MASANRVDIPHWKFPISIFSFNVLYITAGLVVLLCTACIDNKANDVDIKGYWEIAEAFRNEKPTLTLENAFIHIKTDSTLVTNLLRKEIESDYTRENSKISQLSPELIEYQILRLTNDSLELHTEIRGYDFNFILLKKDSITAE